MSPAQNIGANALDWIAPNRLEEILCDAGVFELSVKNDVIPVADHDDIDFRLALCRELIDPRDRVFDIGNVYDQQARRRF